MLPDPRFTNQSKQFWAYVRSISQHVGYTLRKTKTRPQEIRVPTDKEVRETLSTLELKPEKIFEGTELTPFGHLLISYFRFRAEEINVRLRPNLMNVTEAKTLYEKLKKELKPSWPVPMNRQKGEKKTPAYLTGMVNMIVEANCEDISCDYNPQELTSVTVGGFPIRTLARRLDGAFPSAINPISVWEIKEYYYTKTFGSRVADGVYETLLDGLELEELRLSAGIDIKHYLIIDDHFTWWDCGRSYLCRIVDMLHMGYVDEVLVGREVPARLPAIVREWVEHYHKQVPTEPQPET